MDETIFLWNGLEPMVRIRTRRSFCLYCYCAYSTNFREKNPCQHERLRLHYCRSCRCRFWSYAYHQRIFHFLKLSLLFSCWQCCNLSLPIWRTSRKFLKGSLILRLLCYTIMENLLEENLHKERLDKSKVLGAVRKKGFGSMDDVAAVILEIDATLSVIGKSQEGKDHPLLKSCWKKMIFRNVKMRPPDARSLFRLYS